MVGKRASIIGTLGEVLWLLPALVDAVGLWAAKRHQEIRLHVAPVDAQRRSFAWWSDGRRGRSQPNQNRPASKPASVALMQVAKPPEPPREIFFYFGSWVEKGVHNWRPGFGTERHLTSSPDCVVSQHGCRPKTEPGHRLTLRFLSTPCTDSDRAS